jgi:predicted secreted protein
MRPLCVASLIFSSFLLNCVSGNSIPASAPADHRVTEDDNGKEIQVARSDTITVRLGAQLGTGYGWYVTSGPGSLLEQSNPRPKIESNRDAAPGSSEVEVFQFTARGTGRVRLEFSYRRPADKDSRKTFHVIINIR